VAGAVSGKFNGVLSSFYQLSEGDENTLFRAIASFVDDTGQTVSATSASQGPVADVTPEITVPFSYAVDSLLIVKNSTQIYTNNFSQAPIASPTILSNGSPSPIAFITQGSTWTEAGGKAIASSTGVALNPNVSGGKSVFDLALLDTNTSPQGSGAGQSELGLKEDAAFTVTSSFDLVTPPTGTYGMELTDGTQTHGIDQLERLLVAQSGVDTIVELIQANLVTNTQTVLASQTLTAQLAANNQIEFQFSHAANSTQVSGAFALGNNGTFGPLTTFSPTASAFTSSVTWTRADVGAFTGTGVGLNVGPGQSPREGQTLTASATTNDSDATLHYQWQESTNNFATFTVIGSDSPNYVVQESDEGSSIRVVASTTDPDNSQTASVTSATTRAVLDALPTVTTPTITGTAQEGQTLTASAMSGQSDNPVTYAWYSSADGFTHPIGTGATYVVQEGDEGFTIEGMATATNDNGATVSATSAATSVNAVPEGPVLGGATSASVGEGGAVTLGATDTTLDGDDTLGKVTITGLPTDLTNLSGGGTYSGSTWTGTATQFNALSFNAGEQGTFNLSISATTTGTEAGTTTGSYTLTVNPVSEGPVLGGSTSKTVNEGGAVTFGATDATSDSDDVLGSVTITGLPTDLTNFNGGTYTSGPGTWSGTAAQFNALSFTAGHTAGTFSLTISATTTGAEAATTTGTYALTINNPLTVGATTAFTEMNTTVSGYLNVTASGPVNYTIIAPPAHDQSVQIAADGTYIYTPSANYFGTDSFTYQADAGNGAVATGTVTVNVARAGFGPSVPLSIISSRQGYFDTEGGGGDMIAPLSTGGFVATWYGQSVADVFVGVYDQNGNAASIIAIPASANGAEVAALPNGGFAVAGGASLYIFDSSGTRTQTLSTGLAYPSIDASADGTIYLEYYGGGSVERFQAVNGVYSETAYSISSQYPTELKVLGDGDVVVLDSPGSNQFSLYHSTGSGLTGFATGNFSGSYFYDDVAALDNGGFVISSENTATNHVLASIFTAAGGGVATVDTGIIANASDFTHVSALKGGGFVVSAIDSSFNFTNVREFNDNGTPISNIISLSTPNSPFTDTNSANVGGFYLASHNSSDVVSAYINYDAPRTYTGDSGADAFVANNLNDAFTGGAGRNVFQFGSYFGNDTITNFDPSEDVLLFDTAVFPNYAAVQAHFAQVKGADGNTYWGISYNSSETIAFANSVGFSASSLQAALQPGNIQFGGTIQPAGIAGALINLALGDAPADAAADISVSVAGLPSGWSLNAGIDNGNGGWIAQTTDPRSLSVTTPASFVGASLVQVVVSWTRADGSSGRSTWTDNVEAYAPGSPIFAQSGDDTLTGTGNHDTFVFAQPIGNDTIWNFNAATDQIDLIGFPGYSSFDAIQGSLADDANGNAVIALGSGASITIRGVEAATLTGANFAFDQEPSTSNSGTMTIGDGTTLPLGGTINNAGTIALNSIGEVTELELLGPRVTLKGGGQLLLSDNSGNTMSGTSAAVTLDNVDNTISGAGILGDGQLAIVNEAAGMIDAVGNNPLILDSGSNAIVNSGTLRSDGGTLAVRSPVTGAGTAVIDNGTIAFGSAADANVAFAGDTGGMLNLGNSHDFTGQISGFGALDQIDLADIGFGANSTLGYAANSDNTAGTLTVSDGTHIANLALLGSYMASCFATASDGHGGTLITAGATQTPNSDTPVTPPHA
jgi:hypothetical protein